ANNAEARLERGKRIVGNFRTRRGNTRNERGLAHIRKADQAHIRQQLQLKMQVALLSGLSVFGFARRLMPRFSKILIAAPASTTLREQNALAWPRQIGELLASVLIGDHGANRDEQHHVRACMSTA